MTSVAIAAAQTSKRVFDLWFKGFVPGQPLVRENYAFWFSGGKEIDDMLRAELGEDAERAIKDKDFRECMTSTSEGTVALTILLDQIPRNIFRGSPRPFVEFDPQARAISKKALELNTCGEMHPFFRHFLYLPLEHSEDLKDQDMCVKLFAKDLNEVDPMYKGLFQSCLDYATAHQAVIKQFGRFPHRNSVLNRDPTKEEVDYLASGGARW